MWRYTFRNSRKTWTISYASNSLVNYDAWVLTNAGIASMKCLHSNSVLHLFNGSSCEIHNEQLEKSYHPLQGWNPAKWPARAATLYLEWFKQRKYASQIKSMMSPAPRVSLSWRTALYFSASVPDLTTWFMKILNRGVGSPLPQQKEYLRNTTNLIHRSYIL